MSDHAEHVGIVGCGSAKIDEPAPAKNLYSSTYFALKREYVETFCDRWLILSAEHGLIRPTRETAPYETTVTDDDFDREAFVYELALDLEFIPGALCEGDELTVLAGREYADLLREAIRYQRRLSTDAGTPLEDVVTVEYLFQDLACAGIGEQMGMLRKAIDTEIRRPGDGYGGQTDLSRFAGRTSVDA